jgi:hypothetical protein
MMSKEAAVKTIPTGNNQKRVIKRSSVSSYLVMLASFNHFIDALKSKLNLVNSDIKKLLSDPYSNIKDALLSDLVLHQNLKLAREYAKRLKSLANEIKEAVDTDAELKKNEVTIDTPTPDFEFMARDVEKREEEVKKIIKELEQLAKEQEKLNTSWLQSCETFAKDLKKSFTEKAVGVIKNIALKTMQFVNRIRKKIAMEDLEKTGRILSQTQQPIKRKS